MFPAALWLSALGYLTGVVAACLTWESNPHALRSIGAWPFLSLASGYFLMRAVQWKPLVAVTIGTMAIAFSTYYFTDYFLSYPKRSDLWFDTTIVKKAEALSRLGLSNQLPEEANKIIDGYQWNAALYFQLRDRSKSCADLNK
jgi:hypothetical protein